MPQRNVFVLIGDCLRAANVNRRTMPFVTGMADVTVDQYYSNSTWSLPSHASLYSQSDPTAHNLTDIGGRLSREDAHLPRLAQQEGYTTALFSENSVFGPFRGFGHHVDYVDSEINYKLLSSSYSPTESAQHLDPAEVVKGGFSMSPTWAANIARDWIKRPDRVKNAVNLAYTLSQRLTDPDPAEFPHVGDRVVRHATDHLESQHRDGDPSLAFVNLFDAHNPHHTSPPREAREELGITVSHEETEALSAVRELDVMLSDANLPEAVAAEFDSWEDVYRRFEEIYEAQIRHVDSLVERFAAETRTQWDDALVVFLGDHGHLFYDDGLIGHHSHLHPGLLRVPLYVSVPDAWDDRARTIAGPVSHVELSETLSDVIAGEIDSTDEFVSSLDGQNRVIAAADGLSWNKEELYAEYDAAEVDEFVAKRAAVIRDGEMTKYERIAGDDEITKTEYAITEKSREVLEGPTAVETVAEERIHKWLGPIERDHGEPARKAMGAQP